MVQVDHLKNSSTLDCVQLVSSRKISISANSKVPCLYRLYPSCTYVCIDCTSIVYIYLTDCIQVLRIFIHRLYLSVLQLYHRLLTVEQTHKINKLVTLSPSLTLSLSLSLLRTYQFDKICSDLHVLRVSSEQDRAIYTGELCVSNLYLSLYSNCT